MKEWAPTEVEFYKEAYRAASRGNYDIYVVFVERALQLLNEQGRMGYIMPHKFFQAKYGEPLRGLIAEGQHLAEIVHFGDQQVFAGATTYRRATGMATPQGEAGLPDQAERRFGWLPRRTPMAPDSGGHDRCHDPTREGPEATHRQTQAVRFFLWKPRYQRGPTNQCTAATGPLSPANYITAPTPSRKLKPSQKACFLEGSPPACSASGNQELARRRHDRRDTT